MASVSCSDGVGDKNCLGDALGGELGGALATAEASSSGSAAPVSSGDGGPTVAFFLMTRKGNKPQFKNLSVPTDSELAQNLRNREMVQHTSFRLFVCFQKLTQLILLGGESRKRTSQEADFGFQ